MRLYLDIETYSTVNLKTKGIRPYVADNDFEILMCAWAVDDGPVGIVVGEQAIRASFQRALRDDRITKVAHNSAFERTCFSRLLGTQLQPDSWDDTAIRAAVWGYPRALDQLSRYRGQGQEKDKRGAYLVRLFCSPNRGRKIVRATKETHPAEWEEFLQYCTQDVRAMRDIDNWLEALPGLEREVWLTSERINDRGITIDVDMAQGAVSAAQRNAVNHSQELENLLGIQNANSRQQILKALGPGIPDLRADTVRDLLARDTLTARDRRALELRQLLSLSSTAKFQAALDRVDNDGRLRDVHHFFGARTGRYAGRGVQLQNLPRKGLKPEAEAVAITRLKTGAEASPDELKALVRPMIIPGVGHDCLTVCDYSAIEARVIAWLAGEKWVLQAFKEGRDLYVATAEQMQLYGPGVLAKDVTPEVYTEGRQRGKVAVLACGYGGAVNALRVMGAQGTDQELATLVRQYRRANARIAAFWYDLERALVTGGRVRKHIHIEVDGNDRKLWLPSGRPIVYRGLVKAGDRIKVRDFRKGGALTDIWGGTLAENVTQAVARDLLADALVRLDQLQVPVVAHVHDEVIVDGDHVTAVNVVMNNGPKWAAGLPLAAVAETTERYRKG